MRIGKILFSVAILGCVIGLFCIIGFAVYDYGVAHEECKEYKSDNNCDYKVCMAKEYNSYKNIQIAANCIFLYEYDALGEQDE